VGFPAFVIAASRKKDVYSRSDLRSLPKEGFRCFRKKITKLTFIRMALVLWIP
jgi:hypothetical protein